MRKKTFTSTYFILFTLLMIGLISSCRPDPRDDIVVGQSKEDFNESDQRMIGNAILEIMNESSNEFNILLEEDYQEVYIYLNTLMDQIVNTAHVQNRNEFDWKISILKNDEKENAFILPGGHLLIYSGLLKFLEGEHELVAMLAHEMAYVDSDNLMNQLKNEYGSKKLSKIISDDPESHAILSDIADGMGQMVFDEKSVEEADQFCTDIICEFEWDGEGLLSLVNRGGTDPLKTIQWFHSKPVTNDRIDILTDIIHNQVETCGISAATFYQRYLDNVVKKLP